MISKKVVKFMQENNWWTSHIDKEYKEALDKLDIPTESDFYQFYLNSSCEPTLYSRDQEIYHVCWFIINSNYLERKKGMADALELPDEYIAISSFEGGGGFFYNTKTDEVLDLDLKVLEDFKTGVLKPQWKTFNDFIEWFFELN